MLLTAAISATGEVKDMTTPHGIRYAMRGEPVHRPRPVVFVFADERFRALRERQFAGFAELMERDGDYLFVSLDTPGHGDDVRPGEPDEGLKIWRVRLDRDENIVAGFIPRASAVLDHLVATGQADPERVAVAGTSRGGFIALHFAAAEPRVRAVALFSGVTRLTVLQEFKGLEEHAMARSLAVDSLAGRLAGRPVWHCIGNHDERVGTASAVRFSQRLVEAAFATGKRAPVEIHVMESEGHHTPEGAWALSAAWLEKELAR